MSLQAVMIVSTLNPPPDELAVTHRSARPLADHLTTDPRLEAKIRGVVGLYLDPPPTRRTAPQP
jgi:hypothetical protein